MTTIMRTEKRNIVEVISQTQKWFHRTAGTAWIPQLMKFGNYMPNGACIRNAPGAGKAMLNNLFRASKGISVIKICSGQDFMWW